MFWRKIHHYAISFKVRAELFCELNRAAREGIPLPHKLRRRVWKHPSRYDDYIRFLRFLDPRKRIQAIDVGANVGNWAADFLEFFPNAAITSLEPIPATFAKLSARFKSDDRVRLVHAAASGEGGTAEMAVNASCEQNSLHRYLPQEPGYKSDVLEKVSVPLIRLDSLPSDPTADARLMKVDVEGHEVQALNGAAGILPDLDVVIVECAFNNNYEGLGPSFSTVCRILQEANLVPVHFRQAGRVLSPYTWCCDVIFVQQRHLGRLWGW